MARVTYIDKERACFVTTFMGLEFEHKVPREVDDNKHAEALDILEANPYFTVENRKKQGDTPDPDKLRAMGEKAFRDKRPFSIPSKWRYREEGTHWADGYQRAKSEHDADTDARINA